MKEILVVSSLFTLLLVTFMVVIVIEFSSAGDTGSVDKYPIPEGKELRFFIVGDYGEFGHKALLGGAGEEKLVVQYVAEAMARRAAKYPIDFITTTGDNIYDHGMKNKLDVKQFKLMYEIFHQEGISFKPWFAILGNHDCVRPKQEIDAHHFYPMWNMPSDYYQRYFKIDGNKTVAMAFLNGCSLACEKVPGQKNLPYYCDEYTFNYDSIQEQYTWLDGFLGNSSSAQWKFVFTHMPPFSAGKSEGDNEALKKVLYPKLDKGKVDFLFTGHEHIMEYFYIPKNSTYTALPPEEYKCGNYTSMSYGRELVYRQGSGLQEVIIGSSGHEVDEFCPNKTTNMAFLGYGTQNYGFAEVLVTSHYVQVNYFTIYESEPVFSVKVEA